MAIIAEVLPRRWNARAQVYSTIATMPSGMHGVRVSVIGVGWPDVMVGVIRVFTETGAQVAEFGFGGSKPDGQSRCGFSRRRTVGQINPGDYLVTLEILQTVDAGIRIEAI